MNEVKGTTDATPRSPARTPSDRLPAFFYRLAPAAQRAYLRSDAIDSFNLTPSLAALRIAGTLMKTLAEGRQAAIGLASRELADEVCRLLQVRPINVEVRGVRPHNTRGELHGIFYPTRPPRIVLWMRTAQRRQTVKPRTFVRTLLHELGHYFDYTVLRLGDSYHTAGFFKRESSLMRALVAGDVPEAATGPVRDNDRGGGA